jgi:hypothetical protein
MTTAHKEAYLARQANGPAMSDANVETAGIPSDQADGETEEAEETAEIKSDPDTPAAIAEGDADPNNGGIQQSWDAADDAADIELATDLEDEEFDDLGERLAALNNSTVPELKALAGSMGLRITGDILKADLIDLITAGD